MPSGVLDEAAIVYSGGVGEDASFDLDVLAAFGCTVWAFDPTPKAIAFASAIAHPRFRFTPVGIWVDDGPQHFAAPRNPTHVSHAIAAGSEGNGFVAECRSIASLMAERQHTHLALLKLDIEGAEYAVIEAAVGQRIFPTILCLELHGGFRPALRMIRRLEA